MIKVVNEYENLKIVLVHTPGSEINQLTPDNLSRLLFEDMPYLPNAIEEHNQFKKKMKENGTKVIEITKLFNDVIKKSELYKDTIRIFLSEIKQKTAAVLNHVNIFLESINRKEFINYFSPVPFINRSNTVFTSCATCYYANSCKPSAQKSSA